MAPLSLALSVAAQLCSNVEGKPMARSGMADSLNLVSRENEGSGKEDCGAHKWPSRTNSKFYRRTIVSKVEILKSLSSTPGSSLVVGNI